MTKVEVIEHLVSELTQAELADFRHWFAQFDAVAWDRQFEADVAAGRLDDLADQALATHSAGKTSKL